MFLIAKNKKKERKKWKKGQNSIPVNGVCKNSFCTCWKITVLSIHKTFSIIKTEKKKKSDLIFNGGITGKNWQKFSDRSQRGVEWGWLMIKAVIIVGTLHSDSNIAPSISNMFSYLKVEWA